MLTLHRTGMLNYKSRGLVPKLMVTWNRYVIVFVYIAGLQGKSVFYCWKSKPVLCFYGQISTGALPLNLYLSKWLLLLPFSLSLSVYLSPQSILQELHPSVSGRGLCHWETLGLKYSSVFVCEHVRVCLCVNGLHDSDNVLTVRVLSNATLSISCFFLHCMFFHSIKLFFLLS